jgi:hypothetical protein
MSDLSAEFEAVWTAYLEAEKACHGDDPDKQWEWGEPDAHGIREVIQTPEFIRFARAGHARRNVEDWAVEHGAEILRLLKGEADAGP